MIAVKVEDQEGQQTIGEREDVLEQTGGQWFERENADEPVQREEWQQNDARSQRRTNLVDLGAVDEGLVAEVAFEHDQHDGRVAL